MADTYGPALFKGWKQSLTESMQIGTFEFARPQYVVGETIPYKDGMVFLHPGGFQGVPSGNVIKWSGGFNGNIRIVGSVFAIYPRPACGDGVSWTLLKNGTTISSGQMVPVSGDWFRINEVQIASADSIYFVLNPKGEASCDGTALDMTITRIDSGGAPFSFANGYE